MQLGELVPALKARMADSNKNLAVQALQLTGRCLASEHGCEVSFLGAVRCLF